MIRCRCGTWTNAGLTCSKCAAEVWNGTVRSEEENESEEKEEIEFVSLEELEEHEDDDE